MNQSILYAIVGMLVFCIGIYGFSINIPFLKKILSINIAAVGVFIFFIAVASKTKDPVPQAMVLTGIVISVSATAFALALLQQISDFSVESEKTNE